MAQSAYDVGGTGETARFIMAQFTPEEFTDFWPELERALDRIPHTWRHWTKEYICDCIMTHRMQIWGVGPPTQAELILFTTIHVLPAMKILVIPLALGKFDDEVLPLLDATFTNYAQLNGCGEIEIRGRAGWWPKLKQLGFTHESAVWVRPVSNCKLN